MNETLLNLIKEKNIKYSLSGKDYLIKCLNKEHEDTNPSCRVDQNTGVTHCFSCGFKTNLFKYFGFLSNNSSVRIAKLKQKIEALKVSLKELEMPEGSVPWNTSFRGVSATTLKHFGAFRTNDDKLLEGRIIFPLKDVSDKVILFQARHIHSNAQPKYLFYPRHISPPMFPSKLDYNCDKLILVEGIFDMLNLYDKGLTNVSCVFGTEGLTEANAKERLLPFKVQGVNKLYIMFDEDDAGIAAAKKLKPLLEDLEFETELITVEYGSDPGELNQEDVDSINSFING